MKPNSLYQDFENKRYILESHLNYKFMNINLLKEALTHRSVTLLHAELRHYERLEFLGDAVLDLIAGTLLFQEKAPQDEGQLTRRRSQYVSEEALFAKTSELLKPLIIVAKGLQLQFAAHPNQKAERSIISDVCEAIIAVIYLEAGYLKCQEVVQRWLGEIPLFEKESMHPKGALQEFLQKELSLLPRYQSERIGGTDHQPKFKTEVWINQHFVVSAIGHSQKKSASTAAVKSLAKLKKYTSEELKKQFSIL